MENKLYILINPTLMKIYKTHYFLCLGQKELYTRMNFGMKQFVNINSGTIVESAIWKLNYDIKEIYIDQTNQILIDKVLDKKKTKDFIQWLKNK